MFKVLIFAIFITATPLIAELSESEFVQKVHTLIQTSHTAKPWPGFPLSRPVVISLHNGHIYAFQLQQPDGHWQKVAKDIWYSPKDHWGVAQIPFSPFHPLGKEQVMVFRISQLTHRSLFAVVHESFHLHQFQHFPPPNLSDRYCDHMNPTNLALLEVEEAALVDFLNSNQNDALKDFVALNQFRHLFLEPASVEWEHHQQLMEGLADYTAYRLLETAGIAWPETPAQALSQTILSITDYAIQRRHYGVGAALAMALDTLQVAHWKETIERTGKSQGEILAEMFPLKPSETLERVEIARIKYQHSTILISVLKQVENYANELQTHLTSHYKGQGKLIRIATLKNQGGAGGGFNAKTYTLAEGGTLALKDSSTAVSDDQSWKLRLVKVPYLLHGDDGMREFRLSDDAEVHIDGAKVRLDTLASAPHSRHFRSLRLSGKQAEFISEGNEGLLQVDARGTVSILF